MAAEKYRILVVDDEESLRGILQEVLQGAGFEVDCAASGEEAMAKIKAAPFDVVITDIRMGGMSGIELLEQIKKYEASIQVVIMTSNASVDTAIKAIRLGAYDYLTKPFEDLDTITNVINRTIEKLRLEREIQHLLEILQRRNQDIEALYSLTTELSGLLKPEELIKKSVDALAQLCKGTIAYYFVYNEAKISIQARLASAPPQRDWSALNFELKGMKSISNYHKVINNDVELKKRMALAEKPGSVFLLPLIVEARFVGCYALVDLHGEEIDKGRRDLVGQFVETLSTQAEKAKLHEQIRALAIRDGLTGLYNHRYFQNALANELSRAARFKKPVCVLLFDIDNFKHYNDHNGHPEGDYLLKEMAKLLNANKRSIDLVARYGGEEFVMILVETNAEGGQVVAERIRAAIANHPFKHRETQPLKCVSVSMGLAEFPLHAADRQGLITAADQALYRAKEGGRNRVCVAGGKKE